MFEDVDLFSVFLKDNEKVYLCEYDLFCSEESAISVIEIHLLFEAFRIMGNPEFLGVSLQSDVDEAQREDEGDGKGGYQDKESVMVVESCNFLEDQLKVHCSNVDLIMINNNTDEQ